jgi:hypothetical protein
VEDPAPSESEHGAQDLIRSIEDFIEPLAEPTDDGFRKSSTMSIDINGAAAITPDLPESQSSLSATIQGTVNAAVTDLKAKIFDLQQREAFKDLERDGHEAELEGRLVACVEAALVERDTEI